MPRAFDNTMANKLIILLIIFLISGCAATKEYNKIRWNGTAQHYELLQSKFPNYKLSNQDKISLELAIWKDNAECENIYLNLLDFQELITSKYPKLKISDNERLHIEETFFQESLRQNTINGYNKFLDQFPNGQLALHAKKNIENIKKFHWNQALKLDTEKGYQDFIKQFSEGPLADEAQKKLLIIENNFWDLTKKENSKDSFEYYLERYPKGQYRQEASDYLNYLDAVGRALRETKKIQLDIKISGDPIEDEKTKLKNYLAFSFSNFISNIGYKQSNVDLLNTKSDTKIVLELSLTAKKHPYNSLGGCYSSCSFTGTISFIIPTIDSYKLKISGDGYTPGAIFKNECSKDPGKALFYKSLSRNTIDENSLRENIYRSFSNIFGYEFMILHRGGRTAYKLIPHRINDRELILLSTNEIKKADSKAICNIANFISYNFKQFSKIEYKEDFIKFLNTSFNTKNSCAVYSLLKRIHSLTYAYIPPKEIVDHIFKDQSEHSNIPLLHYHLKEQVKKGFINSYNDIISLPAVYKTQRNVVSRLSQYKVHDQRCSLAKNLTLMLGEMKHPDRESIRKDYNRRIKNSKCKTSYEIIIDNFD